MTNPVIELAQQQPEVAAFEAGVLQWLQNEIGFDAGVFVVRDAESSLAAAGLDRRSRDRLLANIAHYARELLPVKQAALARRGVAVDTQVLGESAVRRTRYHAEIAAPMGGRHALLAYVPWRSQVAGVLMLGRTRGTFSALDVRRMEELLPFLGVARATYGLPCRVAPLPHGRAPVWASRLGLGQRTRELGSATTAAGTVTVRDRRGFREMVFADHAGEFIWTRAALDSGIESGWPYVDLMHLAAVLAWERGRALFIGCGGAVAVRQFAARYPGIELDVVEREPAVLDLAQRFYALSTVPHLTAHLDDGFDFVASAPSARWDVAVIDAYDGSELAASFTQPAFFAELRRVLRRGGAMAFNAIGTLGGQGPVQQVVHAARAVFDSVRLVPVLDVDEDYRPERLRNIVVVAQRAK